MLPVKKDLYLRIHKWMLFARLLDEHLIHIYKKGLGYFWVGSPGEEAFNVPLALLIRKGCGLDYDWLHFHYRCTGTLVAMGVKSKDVIRMMMNKRTDPFTGGRNFVHHYSIPQWNVAPVTSIIEMQHLIAIGTAHSQQKNSSKGITIVTGGDAGTASGDFTSNLFWSSRPQKKLPILNIVLNNQWGISTPHSSQQQKNSLMERAKSFGIQSFSVDGNDPIASYKVLKESLSIVRKHRIPVLVEAKVSRLYGHSSSSGAHRVKEKCGLKTFETLLIKKKWMTSEELKQMQEQIEKQFIQETKEVEQEETPVGESVWEHVYANQESSDWRKF